MMQISCGATPDTLLPEKAVHLKHRQLFDHWVLTTIRPERVDELGGYCDRHNIPIRGSHLFLWDRKNGFDAHIPRAEALAAALPNATAWDVVHEFVPMSWAGVGRDWVDRCFDVAQQIAPNADFFASEYRLQSKLRMQATIELIEYCWDKGYRLDGLSVQLHSNLLSLQPTHLGRMAAELQPLIERGLKIHCHESVVWMRGADNHDFGVPAEEHIQARRYQQYKGFAESVGAELFGPWDIWDGGGWKHPRSGQVERQGIWREDWSEKPAHGVFFV
jgi:GH35 family endo-1,4-beta-xylanase